MEKQLDAREQVFVSEYLKDLDPKRAAIVAGYSKSTAHVKSFGWVSVGKSTKKHVFEAILKAQEARLKKTDIDANWVLARLVDEAEADLLDLYDGDGRLKPVALWPLIWRQGLVQGLEVKSTVIGSANGKEEDQEITHEVVKVKLPDRIKRIELIGRHVSVQAFMDRKEFTGADGSPLIPERTPMESARRVLAVMAAAEAALEKDKTT